MFIKLDTEFKRGYADDMELNLLREKARAYDGGLKGLAEKTGLSRTTIYSVLEGNNAKTETLTKIAEALGLEFLVEDSSIPTIDEAFEWLAGWKKEEIPASSRSKHLVTAIRSMKVEPRFALLVCNHLSLNDVNFLALLRSLNNSDLRRLGYLADVVLHDTSHSLASHAKLQMMVDEIFINSEKSSELLLIDVENPSASKINLMRRTDNFVANKWSILTLDSLASLHKALHDWRKVVR